MHSTPEIRPDVWASLTDCEHIQPAWVQEFIKLPEADRTIGLGRFADRIAETAREKQIPITADQLFILSNQLGNLTGTRLALADAEQAIAKATPSTSPASPPAPLPSILQDVTEYEYDGTGYQNADGHDLTDTFRQLSKVCVTVGSTYYVKDGMWRSFGSGETARSTVYRVYHQRLRVTSKLIKQYFDTGLVQFDGIGMFPGCPEQIGVNGKRYINTYRDRRITANADYLPLAEPILRLINENLCGRDPQALDDLFAEAGRAEASTFKWIMHWLAALYQRPGYHIGTGLWFCGLPQGMGKGTLVSIIRTLIGSEYVGNASAAEIGRGWNDFICDRLLIEADEFEADTRADLNRILKEWIANPQINITKRQHSSFSIPNVVNFLFTTNREYPIKLDNTDRRHTLVRVSSDHMRKQLPVTIRNMPREEYLKACAGFGAFLAGIEVDYDFIRTAFDTSLKQDIAAWSASPVQRWFESTDRSWPVGERRYNAELYAAFRAWATEHDPRAIQQVWTIEMFGRSMSELVGTGAVKRMQHPRKRTSGYEKVAYFNTDTHSYHDREGWPAAIEGAVS